MFKLKCHLFLKMFPETQTDSHIVFLGYQGLEISCVKFCRVLWVAWSGLVAKSAVGQHQAIRAVGDSIRVLDSCFVAVGVVITLTDLTRYQSRSQDTADNQLNYQEAINTNKCSMLTLWTWNISIFLSIYRPRPCQYLWSLTANCKCWLTRSWLLTNMFKPK